MITPALPVYIFFEFFQRIVSTPRLNRAVNLRRDVFLQKHTFEPSRDKPDGSLEHRQIEIISGRSITTLVLFDHKHKHYGCSSGNRLSADNSGSQRVAMDIVRKLQQVGIIWDDNAFVAAWPPSRLRPVGDYYAPEGRAYASERKRWPLRKCRRLKHWV